MNELDGVASKLGLSQVVGVLKDLAPDSIAIVGSHGNPKKPPDSHSDLDLVLVFDSRQALDVVKQAISSLNALDSIHCVYLGVHCQFGHVISAYNKTRPLDWVDVGFMDRSFARGYLIDLPLTPVLGNIQTSGARAIPESHLNHLARKFQKALRREDAIQAFSCAARYVGWLEVLDRATHHAMTVNAHAVSDRYRAPDALEYLRASKNMCDLTRLFELVLSDAQERFPELYSAPQPLAAPGLLQSGPPASAGE